MSDSSRHIAFDQLADIAEGRTAADETEKFFSHISTCPNCSAELEKLRDLVALMQSDRSVDAPRDALAYAMNLFDRAPAPSTLRRLVASLTFDSYVAKPAYGVRSGQTQSRQLVYSAEENDIDIRIAMQESKWVISGQVLCENCKGGRVELDGSAGAVSVVLNENCEFTMPPVKPGRYMLFFRLPDVEVEVQNLKLET